MNLIHEPWLPVVRRSGAREYIAPWQLTDRHDDDPVVGLASPRPDFDGALTELLIGLAQTLMPATEDAWHAVWADRPSPDALHAHFGKLAAAFELRGDGPRFMQDLDLAPEVDKRVGQLLMDEPGDKSVKENVDFFVKRGRLERLCEPCLAAALCTLQTYAPSGGAGHRTGLRGGGPMTSIVKGATLWQTVWLNVLPADGVKGDRWTSVTTPDPTVFPWMTAARTSEKKGGVETLPTDVHPLQAFFATPRRIRVAFESGEARCSLCHEAASVVSEGYSTKNYGTNYGGDWRHPLSPHRSGKPDEWIPRHPGPQGIPYQHWLGVIVTDKDTKGERLPAHVIAHAIRTERAELTGHALSVSVYGYDMDNMKARSWQQATMPLLAIGDDEDRVSHFTLRSGGLVRAARDAAGYLAGAVRDVFGDRGDSSGAKRELYSATHDAFYSCLEKLVELHRDTDEPNTIELCETWMRMLAVDAEKVFTRVTQSGHFQSRDPGKIANARNKLMGRLRGPKMRQHLGLPDPRKSRAAG